MSAWDQLLTRGTPQHHIVQFYDHDESLLVTKVALFLREGWRTNDALIAVGTAARNVAIADELTSLGMDVAEAVNSNRLIFFNAEELLAQLAPNGRPEWSCFEAIVSPLLRNLNGAGGGIRAYGEMVGILWSRGQYEAALKLEEFWNRVLKTSKMTLFCAYPIDVLSTDFNKRGVDAVLCAHTHMMPVSPSGALGSAIDSAMRDVLGERAEGLRKLVDTYFRPSWAAVPKAEGMVFWLRHNLPQYADRILDRARSYYRTA